MKRKLTIFVLILMTSISLLITDRESRATGIPVVDVANLGQNILVAVRALQSNLNEVEMIVNQVRQLENDLTNLTSLDYSIKDDVALSLEELLEEIGEVDGLMRGVYEMNTLFNELYPQINREGEEVDNSRASETINKAMDESRRMVEGALRVGGKVLENLERDKEHVDGLLHESERAEGNLSATQVGNQLTATISSNLINLNALMASYAESHLASIQERGLEKAITENRMQNVLRGIDQEAPTRGVRRNPF